MRAILIALAALLLAGCTALDYQPRAIGEREAYAVITAVAMQQPSTPTSIYLDRNYLGFRGLDGPLSGRPQDIRERIYFNSLDGIELHRSGEGYRVRLSGSGGNTLREFHIADRQQAERFVDALAYYRANAPAFTGLK
ncbi:hypothetical protein AAFN46_14500 [Pseudomonas sp. CAU 1711]|uniref:hypothetical protein n=1 Tax=Pseudomonas sp. CAU 1711 TaxID=3140356 RepID=UPI00326059A6